MIPVHGGDVVASARRFGVDPSSLVDFSANISPYGPPPAVADVLAQAALDPRVLAPYPGARYAQLRSVLAARLGVREDQIAIGNGASALIDAAIREARAPAWFTPVPAFSEYGRAVDAAGSTTIPFELDANFDLDAERFVRALLLVPGAGAILNRPHNPSGRTWERSDMLRVLAACARAARPVLLDEAFVDYDPQASLLHETISGSRAVVVRSLTKFYALAGVRIGFAVANEERAASLQRMLPSWPAGSLDERLALAALGDAAYEHRTRERTGIEREHMTDALRELGLHVVPSRVNYLLVDLGIAASEMDPVLRALAARGVLVRDCRSFEGLQARALVRVAVLDRERNDRLLTALSTSLR